MLIRVSRQERKQRQMLEGEINKLRDDIISMRDGHTLTKNLPKAITVLNPIRKNHKKAGPSEELFEGVLSTQKRQHIKIAAEGKSSTEHD